jgi:hypothetical protein
MCTLTNKKFHIQLILENCIFYIGNQKKEENVWPYLKIIISVGDYFSHLHINVTMTLFNLIYKSSMNNLILTLKVVLANTKPLNFLGFITQIPSNDLTNFTFDH